MSDAHEIVTLPDVETALDLLYEDKIRNLAQAEMPRSIETLVTLRDDQGQSGATRRGSSKDLIALGRDPAIVAGDGAIRGNITINLLNYGAGRVEISEQPVKDVSAAIDALEENDAREEDVSEAEDEAGDPVQQAASVGDQDGRDPVG